MSNKHEHKYSDDCHICTKKRLNDAMLLLAELEQYIDEWNFNITLCDRIKSACDAHFGEARPSFD